MQDKFNMDGHKLHWHLDRVNNFMQGKRIAPLHIDLGITTGCNMACTYCYGVIQGRTGISTRTDMPAATLTRFFRDAKEVGVRSIAIIGEGENTVNPAIWDAFACAKEIGLDISLATNGMIVPKDKIYDMLSALTWIRINISAADPESFYQLHRVRQFENVCNNIRALVAAKKEHDLKTTIGMQMVVMSNNMDQIVPLANLGKELGADYLVVKACSDTKEKTLDSPSEKYLLIESTLKEAEATSEGNYRVIIKWHKLQNKGTKDYKVCYGTNFILAISGKGCVYPCGHWFDIRSEEFFMGNINDTSFKDIVASDRYAEVQQKIQKVDVNCECESNCRPHYVNRYLWQLKTTRKDDGAAVSPVPPGPAPEHVNFV